MPEGHILWTHVTSPFIGPDVYDRIIETYFENIDHNDSLMTVTKLQKFIWNDTHQSTMIITWKSGLELKRLNHSGR